MKSLFANIETFKESASWVGQHLFAVMGGILAIVEPTYPLLVVCTFAVFADCYTAWSLSRRVRNKYGKSDGYFKSEHFGRVITTLIKIYAIIVLAFLIDTYVIDFADLSLDNIVAGAVCFWQIWSILENESSCNDAKWAKVAQRIMVDKTARHFNINLDDLKDEQEVTDEN